MATTWQAHSGEFVAGEHYRLRASVKLPYTTATVAALKAAFRAKYLTQPIHVTGFDSAPPAMSAHGGPQWWTFVMKFDGIDPGPREAGLDPRGLIALAAVIAVAGAALYLSAPKVEHLVTETIHAGGDAVKPIFDPTVLILAVVGVFLVARARGRA